MGISFRKPLITRGGNKVKLYHIYEGYIHGAYEKDNDWYIASWHISGHFLPPKESKFEYTSLDLINEDEDDEWSISKDNPRIRA